MPVGRTYVDSASGHTVGWEVGTAVVVPEANQQWTDIDLRFQVAVEAYLQVSVCMYSVLCSVLYSSGIVYMYCLIIVDSVIMRMQCF